MLIEYIGSIIRNEVANRREQIYEKQVSKCRIFPRCTTGLSCVCLSSHVPEKEHKAFNLVPKVSLSPLLEREKREPENIREGSSLFSRSGVAGRERPWERGCKALTLLRVLPLFLVQKSQ